MNKFIFSINIIELKLYTIILIASIFQVIFKVLVSLYKWEYHIFFETSLVIRAVTENLGCLHSHAPLASLSDNRALGKPRESRLNVFLPPIWLDNSTWNKSEPIFRTCVLLFSLYGSLVIWRAKRFDEIT